MNYFNGKELLTIRTNDIYLGLIRNSAKDPKFFALTLHFIECFSLFSFFIVTYCKLTIEICTNSTKKEQVHCIITVGSSKSTIFSKKLSYKIGLFFHFRVCLVQIKKNLNKKKETSAQKKSWMKGD